VRDNLIGFLSGLLVVMTIRTDELLEVMLIGMLGGAAGMIGKVMVAHFRHRLAEWKQIRKLLDPGAIGRELFIKNTVFLFFFWLMIVALSISLSIIFLFIY
jgi:hypothetical protein